MKVLIKNAHIICSGSPYHDQVKDILIVDGTIESISENINENADEIIVNDNLHVSVGWMDIFSNFADPGYEQKETLETGAAAAAAGGFTDVLILPDTQPAVSSKAQVEYIIQKSLLLPVNIFPLGAITKNINGKELAEMYDMHASGAVAFSDGNQPVQSSDLLLKALQYVLPLDGTIIQVPDDKSVAAHGLMNEGIASTKLGIPGKPAMAEELMVARDISLLRYTASKLHLTGVSTRKSIEMLRAAKKEGLQLTASATPYHCFFSDEDLHSYDTNLKVNPPLRTGADVSALKNAILDGTIDCIASHHNPQHWDDKTCEFEYAKNGMIGLETVFAVINSFDNDIHRVIERLTVAPRRIVGFVVPTIAETTIACLTLFDPGKEYIFAETMIRSKSLNSAFIGRQLKGAVIGIINKNRTVINR